MGIQDQTTRHSSCCIKGNACSCQTMHTQESTLLIMYLLNRVTAG